MKELEELISLLDKYPLLTRKWSDYLLFKRAWELVANKEHLTEEGLIKIVSIKSKMNGNGLSDKLNKEFPKLVPIIRPARQEGRSLGSATTV